MQVLECYALNEAPPEQVVDETQPDVAGMNKHMDAILGFRVGHLMVAPHVTFALPQGITCHHIMLSPVFGSTTDKRDADHVGNGVRRIITPKSSASPLAQSTLSLQFTCSYLSQVPTSLLHVK